MPPAGKLPADEIAILTRWVKEGLPWSPEPAPANSACRRPTGRSVRGGRKAHSRATRWLVISPRQPASRCRS